MRCRLVHLPEVHCINAGTIFGLVLIVMSAVSAHPETSMGAAGALPGPAACWATRAPSTAVASAPAGRASTLNPASSRIARRCCASSRPRAPRRRAGVRSTRSCTRSASISCCRRQPRPQQEHRKLLLASQGSAVSRQSILSSFIEKCVLHNKPFDMCTNLHLSM